MRPIVIRLGILMTLLTVIYGLLQDYEYDYLIIKSIAVFFVWIAGAYVLNNFIGLIIKTQEIEEAKEQEKTEEELEEKAEAATETENK